MAKDITRAVFAVWDAEEEIVFIPEVSSVRWIGRGEVRPDNWGDVGRPDDIVLNTTSHIQALLSTWTSLNGQRLKMSFVIGSKPYLVHSSPEPCRRTGSRGGPFIWFFHFLLRWNDIKNWPLWGLKEFLSSQRPGHDLSSFHSSIYNNQIFLKDW